jgi:hypothetical protein
VVEPDVLHESRWCKRFSVTIKLSSRGVSYELPEPPCAPVARCDVGFGPPLALPKCTKEPLHDPQIR